MPQVDHFDSQLPNYAVADFRHDNAGPPLVPAVPEILLAPGVIDYPWRVRRSNQRQYGMTVDTSRLQERSPAIEAYIDQARAQGNKLIYCSLGIMFSRDNARYHRLLDKLRQVAARNPGWSFLAVAPGHVTPPLENFLTVEYAPQLRVLSQAHVFITHGGIHSIQEAIVCGVPMYVLPLADNSDQSGNASRVVYHGLGHRGAIRSESTATLKTKVMDLLTAPRYRANLQAMNNSLHQATDTSEFMDWFLEFSRGVTARQALSAEVGTKV